MKPRIALLIFALALQGCAGVSRQKYENDVLAAYVKGLTDSTVSRIKKLSEEIVSCAKQEPLKIECDCKEGYGFHPAPGPHTDPFNLLISTQTVPGWGEIIR